MSFTGLPRPRISTRRRWGGVRRRRWRASLTRPAVSRTGWRARTGPLPFAARTVRRAGCGRAGQAARQVRTSTRRCGLGARARMRRRGRCRCRLWFLNAREGASAAAAAGVGGWLSAARRFVRGVFPGSPGGRRFFFFARFGWRRWAGEEMERAGVRAVDASRAFVADESDAFARAGLDPGLAHLVPGAGRHRHFRRRVGRHGHVELELVAAAPPGGGDFAAHGLQRGGDVVQSGGRDRRDPDLRIAGGQRLDPGEVGHERGVDAGEHRVVVRAVARFVGPILPVGRRAVARREADLRPEFELVAEARI